MYIIIYPYVTLSKELGKMKFFEIISFGDVPSLEAVSSEPRVLMSGNFYIH